MSVKNMVMSVKNLEKLALNKKAWNDQVEKAKTHELEE
jgi:hypothetical protein